jgi:hypothetical protein
MLNFIKDYGAFIATFLSPVIAVLITLWYQNREARRNAQMGLFLDLVSFRNYIPSPWQYTVALNRVDVIFHRQPRICELWHEYYDLLGEEQKGLVVEQIKEKKVALISAMAKHLGYSSIDQIYLQRYYQTQGHFDEFVFSGELRKELLRVLQSTDTLYIVGNENTEQLKKEIDEYKKQQAHQSNDKPV